jgi:hypothetical protein
MQNLKIVSFLLAALFAKVQAQPPADVCDSAFIHCATDSTLCFATDLTADLFVEDIGEAKFDRWGWTQKIANATTGELPITCDLWMGTFGCENNKEGTKVGSVLLDKDVISFNMEPRYYSADIHVYVGESPVVWKDGTYTVDPAEFPLSIPPRGSFTTELLLGTNQIDLDLDYVIVHSTVCEHGSQNRNLRGSE